MGILPIHADEERDIRAVINVEREDDDDATGTPSEDMETKRAATVEEEMGVSVDMGEEDLIADLAVDTGDKEAEMEKIFHPGYGGGFGDEGAAGAGARAAAAAAARTAAGAAARAAAAAAGAPASRAAPAAAQTSARAFVAAS
uniref:Uncharacterized protein n=1 Tax=Populus alba TaxID=43335 RepID=A0A4U5QHH8_POPAL|nr:hypothetical protein D5086_0000092320 [Populus alba]